MCKFTLQLKFAGCAAWNPLSPVNLGDSALVSKNIYICFLPTAAVVMPTSKKCQTNSTQQPDLRISYQKQEEYVYVYVIHSFTVIQGLSDYEVWDKL